MRLNLPVGKTVQMETNMQMDYYSDSKLSNKMMSMNIILNNQYEVLNKENGIHNISYTVNRMRLDQSMGGQTVSYDSDNKEASNPMAQAVGQQFSGILNTKLELKVNELGEVVEKGEIANPQYAEMMKASTDRLFVKFPEKELTEGEEWSETVDTPSGQQEISMKVNYKVRSITDDQVVIGLGIEPSSIRVDGEPKEDFKLTQEGSMTFDRKTGLMVSSAVNQAMEMENPQMGGKMFVVNTISMKTKS